MVRGLPQFRDWFGSFTDHYALIGGTACDLLLGEAGLSFRATKDLDLVIVVDTVQPEFVRLFWDYIRSGGYTKKLKPSGNARAYRFEKPSDSRFPHMIELFARKPDVFEQDRHSTDTIPLPVDAGHLIALKARAWLDLKTRKETGETIDSHQIKKHRNDIFRLFAILNPGLSIQLSDRIRDDMSQSLGLLRREQIALVEMGIRSMNQEEVIGQLERTYCHRTGT
jgi:hypothetical protein